jgi:2-succinyl-5-enolpyruvyl-6-hydroxy-3-cyclohexene-1-carboxylate synthase
MLSRLIEDKICDSVLRIGGVPTTRFWRDLEDKYFSIPVFSIGYNHFSGLSRTVPHFEDLEDLDQMDIPTHNSFTQQLGNLDQEQALRIDALLDKYPLSEPALFRKLSRHLKNQSVYLGNSLPVRDWDLASDLRSAPHRVAANRGANGIDGQLSTFLGWSRPENENWCLVGDLTALYDLPSLWVTQQLHTGPLRIVVVNNSGGMIFKRMFERDIFLNRHNIKFDHWAKMWSWGYSEWSDVPTSMPRLDKMHVIELVVSEEQTEAFHRGLDLVWKN